MSLNLKSKILYTFIAAFLLVILVMSVFLPVFIEKIIATAIYHREDKLIRQLQDNKDESAMLEWLRKQKYLSFSRISLFNKEHQIIYDSFSKRLLDQLIGNAPLVIHPEVEQAFKEGIGFNERESKHQKELFVYRATRFDFHGTPYVLRVAYPHDFLYDVHHEVLLGVIIWSMTCLTLFGVITWLVINYFTKPIQQIIRTIKPYQEGVVTTIPQISLNSVSSKDDFARLAYTLNSMSNKIQKQMLSLKDFISYASHELKTPITVIQGYAETLHDNPNLIPELYKKITSNILRNCERMNRLIKDLLFLSDVEAIRDVTRVKANLNIAIDHCIQEVKEVYPEADFFIEHRSTTPIVANIDPFLIESALMNLLINSCKYSITTPKITVTTSQDEKEIKICISDQGIGIPSKDLEHIFERFYTVNKSHSRKLGGSGLGLAIVHTIITKHHGIITVESEEGKGTTFTICLPW